LKRRSYPTRSPGSRVETILGTSAVNSGSYSAGSGQRLMYRRGHEPPASTIRGQAYAGLDESTSIGPPSARPAQYRQKQSVARTARGLQAGSVPTGGLEDLPGRERRHESQAGANRSARMVATRGLAAAFERRAPASGMRSPKPGYSGMRIPCAGARPRGGRLRRRRRKPVGAYRALHPARATTGGLPQRGAARDQHRGAQPSMGFACTVHKVPQAAQPFVCTRVRQARPTAAYIAPVAISARSSGR
jgi:hypothetical protein